MERANALSASGATVLRGAGVFDSLFVKGKYVARCFDKNGKLKWEDTIDNVVTDLGANLMLDTMFGGAQNTAYFLGLISSVGYSTPPAVGNTMSSHSGWNEAGNGSNYPNWSTPASNARGTCSWSAAGTRAKALSSAISFVIATNGGTVKGCFIVTGSGAVSTNNNTSGTLYSAGLFTGGDKTVAVGDTLQVSYSTSV
jgi:hypothetical protein